MAHLHKPKRQHVVLEFEKDSQKGPNHEETKPDGQAPKAFQLSDTPGDNVAICCQRLEAGSLIHGPNGQFSLTHTMLEGHRFAIQKILKGAALLSWDMPFGYASRDILPGEYVCNTGILDALRLRNLDFELPHEANFYDDIRKWEVDEAHFVAGKPVERSPTDRYFDGFMRPAGRGAGTRNFVVLLGTTSRTSSYCRALEAHLLGRVDLSKYSNIDGIVAVTHTEGGSDSAPNNKELLLRTLAGFIIHPNIGAVLTTDLGTEHVTNKMLADWMTQHAQEGYDLTAVPHKFMSLSGHFDRDVQDGAAIVTAWLPQVNGFKREKISASHLKIALQCGGSDAFSGISGNPLAAWVSREVIKYGGIAQMAETDELIGAEKYFLSNVRDVPTAKKFLAQVERFKERAAMHGHSAEGNPSGGNKLRGLYNICLKSCGAAMKRNPDVRLDWVIEYSELMKQPGFYFMDSPGNDLESIAGQVASGSNMIFFITGNGSITNFPFVPTIKIVTTTGRYKLLQKDMDVNAGLYLDGTPMDKLGLDVFERTLSVAGGERTAGELAGHAQVQIWRNWTLTQPGADLAALKAASANALPGTALDYYGGDRNELSDATWLSLPHPTDPKGRVSDHIGLILPTSLCSGQIASMIAKRLNAKLQQGREHGAPLNSKVSRFVALPHTEGCGVSSGDSETIFGRTLLGYLLHPTVQHALLLEHGCEKTHNNYFMEQLHNQAIDQSRFGWASVQLDGGIAAVTEKVEKHFLDTFAHDPRLPERQATGLHDLRIGLLAPYGLTPRATQQFAKITEAIVGVGGTVIVPQNQKRLLQNSDYLKQVAEHQLVNASLGYAQRSTTPGFHIMATPTDHWVETLTGLGATGVELFVAFVHNSPPLQTHPMVPVLQITDTDTHGAPSDFDFVITQDTTAADTLRVVLDTASHRRRPKLFEQNQDFQITRGYLGISL